MAKMAELKATEDQFVDDLCMLQRHWGVDNHKMGERLGCSHATICQAKRDPERVSGKLIFRVQMYAGQIKREREKL